MLKQTRKQVDCNSQIDVDTHRSRHLWIFVIPDLFALFLYILVQSGTDKKKIQWKITPEQQNIYIINKLKHPYNLLKQKWRPGI